MFARERQPDAGGSGAGTHVRRRAVARRSLRPGRALAGVTLALTAAMMLGGAAGKAAPARSTAGFLAGAGGPREPMVLAAPEPPTAATAVAGNGQASVSFAPPASDGGAPISSYVVTASPGGVTATGSSSPIVVTGLTNGVTYTFTVSASNADGTSLASAPSNAVTPMANWSQLGAKLAGADAFGFEVALSADGNTALVGSPGDNGQVGGAWVLTRSDDAWVQGPKLTGAGEAGEGLFGWIVSLSSDGNTALVGGPGDNNYAGAAWVFTRSGGVWDQQGEKLTGSVGAGAFGFSLALSGDGNTAVVGSPFEDAARIFVRSGGSWSQQGPKLTGSGRAGRASSARASPCRETARRPLSRGPATTRRWARPGCSPARAEPGLSRAASSPVAARAAAAHSATASRCRQAGARPSSAARTTAPASGPHGCSPARARPGRSRARS